MSHNAVFVGFDRPVSGREGEAHEALLSFYSHLKRLEKEGEIDGYEPVLLEYHGGDLNGFVIIRGHRDQIHTFRHTREWHAAWHDLLHHFIGVGIVEAYVGEAHAKRHEHHLNRSRG